MSFEGVFERWLNQNTMEVGDKEEQQRSDIRESATSGNSVDKEMPVIQQEVWEEEDMEGMPVLQKMVDLPSTPVGRKLCSPPPPPLQITLTLVDSHGKDQNKDSKSISHGRDKRQDLDVQLQAGSEDSSRSQELLGKKSHSSKMTNCYATQAGAKKGKGVSVLRHHPRKEDEGRVHHRCHGKSALSDLIDFGHSTSPSLPRSLERDPVLSPESDMPMEPDSTSEFIASISKWQSSMKGNVLSLGEPSPLGKGSPCSARCASHAVLSGKEALVQVEENLAECDSTSMFMASPSAISPASHGEIEERVCPVLVDRENSNSPAHCVCRCRSLPPPPVLVSREQAQVPPLSSSHLTVNNAAASKQSMPSIQTCPVRHSHSLDDEPAPDLEKVAPSLDLMAAPGDLIQGENDSPPILTLPEQEMCGNQFTSRHSSSTDIPVTESPREAPLLTRYGPESTPQSSRSNSVCDNEDKSPPVLTLHGQEVSSMSSKKRGNLFDFTSNFDWKRAVAETIIDPPSLDAEGKKPGIVIKIRTKPIKPQQPQVSVAGDKPMKTVSQTKKSIFDKSEILSRLRKRHKPEEQKNTVASIELMSRKSSQVQCTDNNANQGVSKVNGSTQLYPHSAVKRQRRSTMQTGDDFKASTQNLSPVDNVSVVAFTKLYCLQSLTHALVSLLFPRLQPHLNMVSPGSLHFSKMIDDLIGSLEQSESQDFDKSYAETRDVFEKLTLNDHEHACRMSPQVVLCRSPCQALQHFRDKVCRFLQLLLPGLSVSLSNAISQAPDQLEALLKKVITANKGKSGREKVCS